MKLFAVLAASVPAMRVNTPAPGFVNEQGAYFADQSSDQSVQVPQQPQLPQVQPPHSTQAPQPGQEDADSKCLCFSAFFESNLFLSFESI